MKVYLLRTLLEQFPDDMHVMLPDGFEPRLEQQHITFGPDPDDQMEVVMIHREDGSPRKRQRIDPVSAMEAALEILEHLDPVEATDEEVRDHFAAHLDANLVYHAKVEDLRKYLVQAALES